MVLRILASDFDGTLAKDGEVAPECTAALRRWKRAGGKLLLITGRELDDLVRIYPDLGLWDLAVVENGAVLLTPASGAVELLGEPPTAELLDQLRAAGVRPLSHGRVILASFEPMRERIRKVLRSAGVERDLIGNKGSLMVLPHGVNKSSGLTRALRVLGGAAEETVGLGDAENDLGFMAMCGLSVAPANALVSVKRVAGMVTAGRHGVGIAQAIDDLLDQGRGPEGTAPNPAVSSVR
ncbi:MAG: HAD family hydrolase [Candidatus Dormibacteria bacterium]